ncbi:MAG: PilX N-terminal domain-containing pilus assembly protein [Gammaproteobacteria bacterium]|nr:PilX N-terminal domain-containing pilus assembly protein [Gammaproteobacteria bacterium]
MIVASPGKAPQRGAALFLSLLLLLLLTVTGVAAVRESGFESRMARNAHDGLLAFQAAEAALASGERMLQRFGSPAAALDAVLPVRGYEDPEPWLQAAVWETAGQVAATGHAVAVAPRFLVEAVAAGGDGAGEGGDETAVFRVVARATGGTPETIVLLESTYVLRAGGTRLSWREVR